MKSKTQLQHIFDAKVLTRSEHSGVLSTHSLSVKGFPFGSVIPFMMNHTGELILYASDIAQHSRNMKTNSKVSMCIYNGANQDSQINARVTLLGNAHVIGPQSDYADDYFMLFPQAKEYVAAHDFQFYKIVPERIRYIGGFGEIYWFNTDDWNNASPKWISNRQSMIDHMHQDHADALALMLNYQHGTQAQLGQVTMLSVCQEGFHVHYQSRIYFIAYTQSCIEVTDIRKQMINLTHQQRESNHGRHDQRIA
jgi:putative heme iron utilization protein